MLQGMYASGITPWYPRGMTRMYACGMTRMYVYACGITRLYARGMIRFVCGTLIDRDLILYPGLVAIGWAGGRYVRT